MNRHYCLTSQRNREISKSRNPIVRIEPCRESKYEEGILPAGSWNRNLQIIDWELMRWQKEKYQRAARAWADRIGGGGRNCVWSNWLAEIVKVCSFYIKFLGALGHRLGFYFLRFLFTFLFTIIWSGYHFPSLHCTAIIKPFNEAVLIIKARFIRDCFHIWDVGLERFSSWLCGFCFLASLNSVHLSPVSEHSTIMETTSTKATKRRYSERRHNFSEETTNYTRSGLLWSCCTKKLFAGLKSGLWGLLITTNGERETKCGFCAWFCLAFIELVWRLQLAVCYYGCSRAWAMELWDMRPFANQKLGVVAFSCAVLVCWPP